MDLDNYQRFRIPGFLIVCIAITLIAFLLSRHDYSPLEKFQRENSEYLRLAKEYKRFINQENYDAANQVQQKVLKMPELVFVSTVDELREFAQKLTYDKNYLESVFFYHMASNFQEKHPEGNSAALGFARITEGLKNTTKAIMENKYEWFYYDKRFVRNHVIPLMHEMRHKIQNLENTVPYNRWVREAQCLLHIALCQYYIEDFLPSEETIKLALKFMEERFGEKSSRFVVYGDLLNNLGVLLTETIRNKEAEIYYTKALDAYKTAKDYAGENIGAIDNAIANTEDNLQIARKFVFGVFIALIFIAFRCCALASLS